MADNPFYLVDTSELPENLLLIDDVLTTGATMAAAASVLNNREQAKVHTFSLAQG
jgi:predicted amidophosphoribosyltransferase